MAGGKGSRMNLDSEKLLLKYKKPVILHVVDSLNDSKCFSKILALTSVHSPNTKKLLKCLLCFLWHTITNKYKGRVQQRMLNLGTF